MKQIALQVNREKMTIIGIAFDTVEEFKGAWYALSSNAIESYQPSVQDVERLKSYVTSRRGAVAHA